MPKTVKIDASHPGENVKLKISGTITDKPLELHFSETNANLIIIEPKTYQPGAPAIPVTNAGISDKSLTVTPGLNGWAISVRVMWNASMPGGGVMDIDLTGASLDANDPPLKFTIAPDMKAPDGPAVSGPITFVSSTGLGGVDQQMGFVINIALL